MHIASCMSYIWHLEKYLYITGTKIFTGWVPKVIPECSSENKRSRSFVWWSFKMSTPSDKRQITNPKLNFLVQKCNIMSNEKRSPHPICWISPFNLNEHFWCSIPRKKMVLRQWIVCWFQKKQSVLRLGVFITVLFKRAATHSYMVHRTVTTWWRLYRFSYYISGWFLTFLKTTRKSKRVVGPVN